MESLEWTDLFSPTKKPVRPVKPARPIKAANKPELPSVNPISSDNGEQIESLEWTDIFGPKKKSAFKPKLPSIPSSPFSSENGERIESLEWTDIFGSKKKAVNKHKLPTNGPKNQNVESTGKSVTPTIVPAETSTPAAILEGKTEDIQSHLTENEYLYAN